MSQLAGNQVAQMATAKLVLIHILSVLRFQLYLGIL